MNFFKVCLVLPEFDLSCVFGSLCKGFRFHVS